MKPVVRVRDLLVWVRSAHHGRRRRWMPGVLARDLLVWVRSAHHGDTESTEIARRMVLMGDFSWRRTPVRCDFECRRREPYAHLEIKPSSASSRLLTNNHPDTTPSPCFLRAPPCLRGKIELLTRSGRILMTVLFRESRGSASHRARSGSVTLGAASPGSDGPRSAHRRRVFPVRRAVSRRPCADGEWACCLRR